MGGVSEEHDDGLPYRKSGAWAREKLDYLERYVPPALTATLGARRPKKEAVYLDLYSGPGMCEDDGGRFRGSSLRAATIATGAGLAFTSAHLVNIDPEEAAALRKRLDVLEAAGELKLPRASIVEHVGDANALVQPILGHIDPWAYVLAMLDPESPRQLDWTTVEALRRFRGHRSVDLYLLFPTSAFVRMLSYDATQVEANARAATAFFGDESWRSCLDLRRTDESRIAFRGPLIQAYLRRLRSLWRNAEHVLAVNRQGEQRLYDMLFASDHQAGKEIATWARQAAETRQQLRLPLD